MAASKKGSGSTMSRFYIVVATVAVLGVAAVAYAVGPGSGGTAATAPIPLSVDDSEALVAMARGVTRGDPSAPVTIIEFGDYQCPGCGYFARNVKPQVDAAFVQTGQAKFVFYDYPLVSVHPHAFVAARSARCAEDQGKFWEYHDEVFRQQERWSPLPSALGAFEDYAAGLELDVGAFLACVNSDMHAEVVSANLALAGALRVPQTPTVLVNVEGGETRILADTDFATIQRTIEEMTR
jgi:protein-disulfide isomerase